MFAAPMAARAPKLVPVKQIVKPLQSQANTIERRLEWQRGNTDSDIQRANQPMLRLVLGLNAEIALEDQFFYKTREIHSCASF